MPDRRVLIGGVAAAALTLFAGGAWYVQATKPAPVAPAPVAADLPLIRAHSPVLGPEDAPVTIVEFFDPACEACKAFHPAVKKIMADFRGKVRVVMRYAAFHDVSPDAVRLLEAARKQGIFEPVLEALYATQSEWAAHDGGKIDLAWRVARRIGLDQARAKQDSLAPEVTAILNQDMADVKTADVRGTPTFFINGQPLAEFGARQLYDQVKAAVEATS